jgi:hypothetical protein
MKKSILNLKGAHQLSKKEQKTINGGISFGMLNGEFGNYNDIDGCKCYNIIYGVHNGPGNWTYSTEYSTNAVPVGWSPVSPKPACCL